MSLSLLLILFHAQTFNFIHKIFSKTCKVWNIYHCEIANRKNKRWGHWMQPHNQCTLCNMENIYYQHSYHTSGLRRYSTCDKHQQDLRWDIWYRSFNKLLLSLTLIKVVGRHGSACILVTPPPTPTRDHSGHAGNRACEHNFPLGRWMTTHSTSSLAPFVKCSVSVCYIICLEATFW